MNLKKIRELEKVKSVNKTDNEVIVDTKDFTYTQDDFGETLVMKTDDKTDLELIKNLLSEDIQKEFTPEYEWENSGRNYFLYNDNVYLDLDGEYFVLDKKYLDIENQIRLFRRNEDIKKAKHKNILSIIDSIGKVIDSVIERQDALLDEALVI